MKNYYVIVAGNGKTSRVNVEVLLEDHYHANGDGGVLVVPFNRVPSEGQVWALQLAKAKKKEAIVFASELANFTEIDSVSAQISSNPIKDAVDRFAGDKTAAFLLWSDEDEDCLNILSECNSYNIPAFDLTEGLVQIKPNKEIKFEQESMPVHEEIKEEKLFDIPKHIKLNLEDEDEEESEEDVDLLYESLDEIARIFASLVVQHIKDGLQK
jgi:hypothetical protein